MSPFAADSVLSFCVWDFLMTSVTIRVLEGMEQGRVYSRLQLPVSLGREDENSIQLNDDRISRFHAKLQDHKGRVILTDLDSTNGTRVNGRPVQMRILQIGDVISVGRCVLLLAARQDDRTSAVKEDSDPFRTAFIRGGATVDDDAEHLDFVDPLPGSLEDSSELFPNGRPELPSELNTLQQVQLSDLLSFVHEQVGRVIGRSVEEIGSSDGRTIQCDWETWANLVSLQSDLSDYICQINTPKS